MLSFRTTHGLCVFLSPFPLKLCACRKKLKCHKHLDLLVSHECALLPPDEYLTCACVSAGCPICPHVFGILCYLTAVNKQCMPLNLDSTLYPDTQLSNHLDFLSRSASSYGKENTWRSSTDNTEAHYLLRSPRQL